MLFLTPSLAATIKKLLFGRDLGRCYSTADPATSLQISSRATSRSHFRLAFTSESIGRIRPIRSCARLSRAGSMTGILGAGVVLCSGASETTTCDRSGRIRSPEVMLAIPRSHSSLHAVPHRGVCTTPVRSTAIASSQHACSHAPQKVHRSADTSIFLSSGMYHAFAGQTLKHAWQPSGSHFMSHQGCTMHSQGRH